MKIFLERCTFSQFFSFALLALSHASLNVFILNLRNSVQLRVAETSYEEAEARVKELEKQVMPLVLLNCAQILPLCYT